MSMHCLCCHCTLGDATLLWMVHPNMPVPSRIVGSSTASLGGTHPTAVLLIHEKNSCESNIHSERPSSCFWLNSRKSLCGQRLVAKCMYVCAGSLG